MTLVLVHPDLGHPQSVATHVGRQVLRVGFVGALDVCNPRAGQHLHAATTLPNLPVGERRIPSLDCAAGKKAILFICCRKARTQEPPLGRFLDGRLLRETATSLLHRIISWCVEPCLWHSIVFFQLRKHPVGSLASRPTAKPLASLLKIRVDDITITKPTFRL